MDVEQSEAASVTAKGGRPRVMSAGMEDGYRQIFEDLSVATRRTVQGRYFANKASVILMDDNPNWATKYAWIWPDGDAPGGRARWGVLEALGRLDDREAILEFAWRLCEAKLPVKDAIRRIRAYRTGKQRDLTAGGLASAIITAIHQHAGIGVDADLVTDALNIVRERLLEAASDSE